jgi:hypothetical protein
MDQRAAEDNHDDAPSSWLGRGSENADAHHTRALL